MVKLSGLIKKPMFTTLLQLVSYLDKGILPLTKKSGLLVALVAISLLAAPSSGKSVSTIPLMCSETGTVAPNLSLYWSEARTLQPKKSEINSSRKQHVFLTAYTSEEAQTDSTPFITASNSPVRNGVVAANFLPFGTRLKIKGFGDKVFIVEDRMNPRFNNYVDIWMESKADAVNFGIKRSEITILD